VLLLHHALSGRDAPRPTILRTPGVHEPQRGHATGQPARGQRGCSLATSLLGLVLCGYDGHYVMRELLAEVREPAGEVVDVVEVLLHHQRGRAAPRLGLVFSIEHDQVVLLVSELVHLRREAVAAHLSCEWWWWW
jgi:hypothetical protein